MRMLVVLGGTAVGRWERVFRGSPFLPVGHGCPGFTPGPTETNNNPPRYSARECIAPLDLRTASPPLSVRRHHSRAPPSATRDLPRMHPRSTIARDILRETLLPPCAARNPARARTPAQAMAAPPAREMGRSRKGTALLRLL